MSPETSDKVIIWTFVALCLALYGGYLIWLIFGDHHAHDGAMQYLRMIHTG